MVLIVVLVLSGSLLMAVGALAQQSTSYDLACWSVTTGGGGVRTSASFRMIDALGQNVNGAHASPDCTARWHCPEPGIPETGAGADYHTCTAAQRHPDHSLTDRQFVYYNQTNLPAVRRTMNYLRTRSKGLSMRSLMSTLLILAVIVAAMAGVGRAAPLNQTGGAMAVAAYDQINIRSGPSTSYVSVGSLALGQSCPKFGHGPVHRVVADQLRQRRHRLGVA